MINVTRLLTGSTQPADALRYGRGHGSPMSAAHRKPIVVWNITRRCNLRCMHCYSDSTPRHYPGELRLDESLAVLDDLAAYGIPGVLLSGGEPTLHPHFSEIVSHAVGLGLRVTVSTNGTLLDADTVGMLKRLGVVYIGISLDGIGACHDHFRGRSGTFEKVVNAFRLCRSIGQKAGLRLTLTRHTVDQLDDVLDFIEAEDIRRVCFYHLVYSGRGADLGGLPRKVTRDCLERIATAVVRWHAAGHTREVLTVGQPADGPFFYLLAKQSYPERVCEIRKLIEWNGGGANGSGIGIGNIDSQGDVHPDQFWQTHPLGNVRNRAFSKIWGDPRDDVLIGLRDRLPRLTGRCADCRFLPACGGGFRVRAFQKSGDPWSADPGCYLFDSEIAGEFA